MPMQNATEPIKSMTIIWLSFIAGLTTFAGIVFLILIPTATAVTPADASIYYVIAVVLATAGMVGSHFMYQVQVRNAAQLINAVPEKLMAQYQAAFLVKSALLIGPGMFSVMAGFVTQQVLFAALTAGILVLMVIAKPSEVQFRQDFLHSRDR
jgi:hypothetical protein